MKRRVRVTVKDPRGIEVELTGRVNTNGYPLTRDETNHVAGRIADEFMVLLTRLPYVDVKLSEEKVEA